VADSSVSQPLAPDTPDSNNQTSIVDSQSVQQSTSQPAIGRQEVLSPHAKTVIPLSKKDNNFDLKIEQDSVQPTASQENSQIQSNLGIQSTSLPAVAGLVVPDPAASHVSSQAPSVNQFQVTQTIAQNEPLGLVSQQNSSLETPTQVNQPINNGNNNGLSQINIDQHGNLRSKG
jgi:hypothetical protein